MAGAAIKAAQNVVLTPFVLRPVNVPRRHVPFIELFQPQAPEQRPRVHARLTLWLDAKARATELSLAREMSLTIQAKAIPGLASGLRSRLDLDLEIIAQAERRHTALVDEIEGLPPGILE